MRRVAFLVGNDDFPEDDSIPRLRFPQNDAKDLAEILGDKDTCGFETKLYLNKSSQAVLGDFEETTRAGDLTKNDTILFYYSGHGILWENELCLASSETKRARLNATSIEAEKVLKYLQGSFAKRRVLILDCCHSGLIGGKGGDTENTLTRLADSYGTFILTASTANQYAGEKEKEEGRGKGNGVFTKALLDCLREGPNESITVVDLYQYAFKHLRQFSNQTPLLRGDQERLPIEIGNFRLKRERERRERQRKRLKAAREKLWPLVGSGHLTKTKFDKSMQLLEADNVEPWEQEVRNRLERYADGENLDLVDLFAPSVSPVPPPPKVDPPPPRTETQLGERWSLAGSEGVNGIKIPGPNKSQLAPIVPEELEEPPDRSDFDKHVPPVKEKSAEDATGDTLSGLFMFQCIALLAQYLIPRGSWQSIPIILGWIFSLVGFSEFHKIDFKSVKQVMLMILIIGAFCFGIYLTFNINMLNVYDIYDKYIHHI